MVIINPKIKELGPFFDFSKKQCDPPTTFFEKMTPNPSKGPSRLPVFENDSLISQYFNYR